MYTRAGALGVILLLQSARVAIGPVEISLPPGMRVVADRRGAEFGGVLIELDERTRWEVASPGGSASRLRAIADSVRDTDTGTDPDYRPTALEAFTSGSIRGWSYEPYCGDCRSRRAILAVGAQVVLVAWDVDGLGSATAGERNRRVRDALATLRVPPG